MHRSRSAAFCTELLLGSTGRRGIRTLRRMNAETVVTQLGKVAHRSAILSHGITGYELGRAVHDGSIVRVRRAWYATRDAHQHVVSAVRVGGSLTAVSAAAFHGLWTLDDGLIHVSVPRNGSRLRSQHSPRVGLADAMESGVCIHWRRVPGADLLAVRPIVDTLVHAIECQSVELAVVLIDSALNLRRVTLIELTEAFATLPRKYRRVLAKAELGAQSGTETLVRLRLRALGMRVRIQVQCGAARVDVLVGDRFVIECHSRAHHTGVENYARDRARELQLVDDDYLTLTLSFEQILYDWPEVEAVIRRRVAAGDHLWPRTCK